MKGAQLFRIWGAERHRPTRDLDFLGYGEATEEAILKIFTELTRISVDPPDGLEWVDVVVVPIRDEVAYGGVRATLMANLAGARLKLQIDIGFGDAITPGALEKVWQDLLPFPSARLLVYPPETVIAEKLEAAVSLGIENSRMKDFFDLHWLQGHLDFDGKGLTEAVTNTFVRRETSIPNEAPLALTAEFSSNENKIRQWNAFLRKGKLPHAELSIVLNDIAGFLLPVLQKQVADKLWTPSEQWDSITDRP